MRTSSRDFFQVHRWLLILVAISGSFFAGCSEEKPEPPIMLAPNRQVGPPETDLEKQVRTHGWWTERVDLENVRMLVGRAQECSPGRTFVFDSRAYQTATIQTSDIRQDLGVPRQTSVPNPAWIPIHSGGWSKEKILKEILKALDEALERRSGKN